MSSKIIKAALKEARDHIKNKEYKLALEKCQEIIKEDSNNYMGLVLMGAAYQESDKKEAAACLRKALKCGPDPTVALQGLANCADIEELPDIYRKLLKHVPDKSNEYHAKIVTISSENKVWDDCVEILEAETMLEGNPDRVQSAWQCLSKVFLKQSTIPEKWNKIYKTSLESAINDSNSESHIEVYKRYIKFLFNIGDISECLQASVSMVDLYTKEIYPLEWICKIYSENVDNIIISFDSILKHPIEWYAEELLNLNSCSPLALLVKSIKLYNDEKYTQSRDLLLQAKAYLDKDIIAAKYLALCSVKLGAFEMARREFDKLDLNCVDYALALSYDNENKENLRRAIEICEKIEDETPGEIMALYSHARALFQLNEIDKANTILEDLRNILADIHAASLQAEFESDPGEAIKILQSLTNETFETELVKGKKYLECEQYENALICLLKATRHKPYYSECFLHLGLLYTAINDRPRGRKCFEKCVYLNPMNEKAITHLTGIYRKDEEWNLNYALLQNSINYFKNSKWPLIQMGLHSLSLEKFNEAIDSFRSALRIDINDIMCWEGLADSYFHRGSFNSAMKVYEKIMEIDPENTYARLQVGAVKLTLHMYSEAIESFTELLETHPDYLAALKGAADAHYNYALYLLSRCLFGRCKEHLQKATDCLQRIFLIGNRNMIWLWRLLANVFVATARLAPTKAFLNVSGKLAVREEDTIVLEKGQLFEFAGRFYTCTIKLNPKDAFLWHEMSVSYYHYAMTYSTEKAKHLNLALNTSKQSIHLQPNRWQNWNMLGVICATNEINNLPLSQHCFIKALQIDKKSYSAWTNLGVLYLKQGEIKLANKAFGRAQRADTEFVNAWVGQAIIAERIGQSDEAMDLFRHCTQLGFHAESAIGYGYWVCNILSNPENMKESRHRYAIENMFAVPVALDSMNWYYSTMGEKSALEPMSYLGFLNSRQQLNLGAIKTFEYAMKIAEGPEKDKMLCNLGYSYLRTNQLQEAIKAFDEVSEASFKSYIGLALARFRATQYQDSYSVYNLALEWLANSDKEKSLILVAMSSMVYAAQGEADTKNILLQCIGLSNPPIQALLSACALGILHQDKDLMDVVMDALKPYENDEEYCHHIAYLVAHIYAINKQTKKGMNHLLSKVHEFPGRPRLRRALTDYLVQTFRKSKRHLGPASIMAESTVVLELRNPQRTKEMSLNASKYLAIAGEAMKRIDKEKSMKLAQRAIHLNPLCQEAWDVLVECKA